MKKMPQHFVYLYLYCICTYWRILCGRVFSHHTASVPPSIDQTCKWVSGQGGNQFSRFSQFTLSCIYNLHSPAKKSICLIYRQGGEKLLPAQLAASITSNRDLVEASTFLDFLSFGQAGGFTRIRLGLASLMMVSKMIPE